MTASAGMESQPDGSRGIWIGAIVCLVVLALFFLWFPLSRIDTFQQVNYNEGWNSYRQQMASRGLLLYALPPDLAVTNYPPLSFHLIGFLGKLTGDMTAAGRWVALLSLISIALLVALLVRLASAPWRLGIYASILFLTWLAVLSPDRIGMNDPHLFGMAFSFLGLYLYARRPESDGWLCGSAMAFITGLFIKQSLIALPAAVALHLLIERAWRRFAIWTAAMILLAGMFLVLSLRDGEYFWAHLLTPRHYSFLYGWLNSLLPYLLRCQVALVAALFWCIWTRKTHPRGVLVAALAVSSAVGIWFAGGDGVDKNVLFESLASLAIATAIAVGDLDPIVQRLRFGQWLLPVLLAAPAVGCLMIAPTQFPADRQMARLMPKLETDIAQAVEFLKARPGPALCENLLLCYESDKPLLYDAFFVDSQIRVGRVAESDIVRMINGGQFRSIQLDTVPNDPLAPVSRMRFTTGIMQAITEHYKPKVRSMFFAILVPREEP
jgi:hypothetical protein